MKVGKDEKNTVIALIIICVIFVFYVIVISFFIWSPAWTGW